MTTLTINACTGRMGRELIKAAIADKSIDLHTALARKQSAALGMDVGMLVGLMEQGVFINDTIPQEAVGVAIDFSLPDVSMTFLRQAHSKRLPVVLGTTGFSNEQLEEIHNIAQELPVVMAANFSIGVNVLLKVASETARLLGNEADIEIFEAHHKHKVDAPSGTALALGEAIATARNTELETVAKYDRTQQRLPRQQGEIGFSVMRAGEIIGDHDVTFALNGEIVSLKHHAQSRQCFAQGAIRAAKWLEGKPAGLYSMQDVIA